MPAHVTAVNFVGVDVGTGSARAAVFTADGRLLGRGEAPITTWQPAPLHVEQSSDEIWSACCSAVREAVSAAGCEPGSIGGLAFDATCSLVALGVGNRPVSISTSGRDEQNVVVWMDHRAVAEAAHITATGGEPLAYVGDVMSPEMQTPKLLWLKRHLPDAWQRATRFLDLPDFLVYRATGDDRRSMCSAVCKWTYLGGKGAWDAGFLEAVGLGDLADEGFARIGREVVDVGVPMGSGLHGPAAADLGLPTGLPVSSSIIDAHAGALGVLGIDGDGSLPVGRLALVFGTSACHLTVSAEARFADATGLPVVLPAEADSVLLGGAVLASVASGHQPRIGAAMRSMARARAVVQPRPDAAAHHHARYRVYRRMHDDQLAYRAIMSDVDGP